MLTTGAYLKLFKVGDVVGGVLVVIRIVVVIVVRLAKVIITFFIGVSSSVLVAVKVTFVGWVILVNRRVVGADSVVFLWGAMILVVRRTLSFLTYVVPDHFEMVKKVCLVVFQFS